MSKHAGEEKYQVNIGEEGSKSLVLLDKSFNPTTQEFLLNNGLKPNMHVLDLGCGSGVMSCWLASQVGKQGSVLGIDNSEKQIKAAERAKPKNLTHCHFKALSAYDIEQLNQSFDLVYCRFLLHHLNEPDRIIASVKNILKPGGIFVCEEGIVDHAFSYPPSDAFKTPTDDPSIPDKNIGKKLYYKLTTAGFSISQMRIIQPLLIHREDKALLLLGLLDSKQYFSDLGHTETEWQHMYDETEKLIDNDSQIVGFYASGQIAGIKK